MSDQTTAPAEATTEATEPRESLARRLLGGAVGRNLGLVIALLLLVAVGAITAGDRFWNFSPRLDLSFQTGNFSSNSFLLKIVFSNLWHFLSHSRLFSCILVI